MSTFLVTTTVRHCKPGQASGYVFTVDLERRRVTGCCPMIEPPHRDADPNPRGGMRGAKGIVVLGDQVLLANASVVYRFDRAWNVVGSVSHPSCASIHDIVWRDRSLWVTSCCNDLVVQFDLDGTMLRHFNARSHPDVCAAVHWTAPDRLSRAAIRSGAIDFRDPRTHRAEDFDGAHVNSLCFLSNGDLLVLLGHIWSRLGTTQLRLKGHLQMLGIWAPLAGMMRQMLRPLPFKRVARGDLGAALASANAAILRVTPLGDVSVVWQLTRRRMPTHSLIALPDDTILVNDTSDGCIVHLDPAGGVVLARTKVTDTFLRGICPLPQRHVLVGCQRDLVLMDLGRQKVVDSIRLTENPHVSIFAIAELPPAFVPLPARFDGTAAKVSGVQSKLCGTSL